MKKGIEIYNSENVQEIRENLDDMKEKYEHKKEEIKSKHTERRLLCPDKSLV